MSIREIPKAILALQKAFEYLTSGEERVKLTSLLDDSD